MTEIQHPSLMEEGYQMSTTWTNGNENENENCICLIHIIRTECCVELLCCHSVL